MNKHERKNPNICGATVLEKRSRIGLLDTCLVISFHDYIPAAAY